MVLEAINDASKLIHLLESRGFPLKLSPENIDREFLKKENKQWLSNIFHELHEFWPTLQEMEQYRQLEKMKCFKGFLDDDPDKSRENLQNIQELTDSIKELNELIAKNRDCPIVMEATHESSIQKEENSDKEEERSINVNDISSLLNQSKWIIMDAVIKQLKLKDDKLALIIDKAKFTLEELKFPKRNNGEKENGKEEGIDRFNSEESFLLPIDDSKAINGEPTKEYYEWCCKILLNRKALKEIPLESLLHDHIVITLQRWKHFHKQHELINTLEIKRRMIWESLYEKLVLLEEELQDYDEYLKGETVQCNEKFALIDHHLPEIVVVDNNSNSNNDNTFTDHDSEMPIMTEMKGKELLAMSNRKGSLVIAKGEWNSTKRLVEQLREYKDIKKQIKDALDALEEKASHELQELQNDLALRQ